MNPQLPDDLRPQLDAMLAYINATPELLSLLYDMDLMPEQVEEGSHPWKQMVILSEWHRHKNGLAIAQEGR